MAFQKILLAYDGSEHSKKALSKTVELAKCTNGEVIVLYGYHVYIIPPTASVAHLSVYMSDEDYKNLNMMAKKEGERILDEAKQMFADVNVQCKAIVAEGNAALLIQETAEKYNCDLIVMGSHGYGPFKELMLGSVSHKVAQIADIPVLIVK